LNRIEGLIGLCARARRLETGADACEKLTRSGRAKVVIVDSGASANTKKALSNACETMNVPLIEMEKDALGACIGKPGRMAAATADASFAKRILELYTESAGGVLGK